MQMSTLTAPGDPPLRLCPWGHEAVYEEVKSEFAPNRRHCTWMVSCNEEGCTCFAPCGPVHATKREAAEVWNARPGDA
jgi:hypothetical protein